MGNILANRKQGIQLAVEKHLVISTALSVNYLRSYKFIINFFGTAKK
jgi:hypothetical protein